MRRTRASLVATMLVMVIVATACGGSSSGATGSGSPTSTQPDGSGTTAVDNGNQVDLISDLSESCEFITDEAMGTILGVLVIGQDVNVTNTEIHCNYLPVDGPNAGMSAVTSVLAAGGDDCVDLLQTKPSQADETVEDASAEYFASKASYIVSANSAEAQVCTPALFVTVLVSGPESVSSDRMLEAAQQTVDLILNTLE